MNAMLMFVLLVLVGVQAALPHGIDDVTNGMSRADVAELMGKPKGVLTMGTDEILLYANGMVTLQQGKVISLSLSPQRQHEEPQPPGEAPASPTPRSSTPMKETNGIAWQTDFTKASADAAQTHRYLLLDFTGSDWCGFCIKLEKEVLDTPEFALFATSQFVCVRVDFPRKKTQEAELKKQNAELAKTYAVHGYPTVVILTPDGKLVGSQSGYRGKGQAQYVESLKTIMADYEKKHPAT